MENKRETTPGIEAAIETLDGRNSPTKTTTVIHNRPTRQNNHKPMTDDEYAAYLAGEYEMLFRLERSGRISMVEVAWTLNINKQKARDLQHMWAHSKIEEQRDTAGRMIQKERGKG